MEPNEQSTAFRCRLREILTIRKLKQSELARITEINARTINRWVKGHEKSLPRAETLVRLSDVLNVTINYLLGDETLEESDAKRARQAVDGEKTESVTIEDFARIRREAKNLEGFDDDELDAMEAMMKGVLGEVKREKAMRVARNDGAA
jgi:transcriptional regulator with XRE-family HTH domain